MLRKKEHKELTHKSYELRKEILKMIYEAKSGHPGGSFSIIDVLTILYNKVLKHDPKVPSWKLRDRVILSAGHICPALYATLADQGYFPKSKLKTLRKLGSGLQGHPELHHLPGVENTGGPLGQGIPFAVGKALALKTRNIPSKIYCVTSDGEHQEGSSWEAIGLAAHHKLSNLCVIVDRNNIQIGGKVEEQMALRKLKSKYHAFGWNVVDINGHNLNLIYDAFRYFKIHKRKKPFCIVAHTILGKGVSFMQDDSKWHGSAPNKEQLDKALAELDKKQKKHVLFFDLKKRGIFK